MDAELTIEDGNKLILLFMGAQETSSTTTPSGIKIIHSMTLNGRPYRYFDKDAEYHKSWDSLMPVLKKISEKSWTYSLEEELRRWDDILLQLGKIEIMSVWSEVVKFIEWHNSYKINHQ